MISSPLTLLTDSELVLEFQNGNAQSFDQLMQRHKDKAVQLAWVKSGNWEDAKDIAQEAFVKAYNALLNFRGEAKFSTWLYTLVMNTARDHWRKKHPYRWLSWHKQADMDFFFESCETLGGQPDRTLESKDIAQKIALITSTLPERQRLIFTLRFLEDLPLTEISQILGISEGTVKAGLHFALIKFKKAFNQSSKKPPGGNHGNHE